ncbi:MAG: molybdenum transporter, periplasmic molybdate-binding protein [Acidobacteriaceae bacterium]|nr:molybdenum transporter, periplasmic molybdate-binding protein [Acidobacteriaceae bacterium]
MALLTVFGAVRSVPLFAQVAKELRVAAATDLQPVMPAFAAAYEKKTGVKLVVSFGSSGTLATQILNGAPVDVFLGADFTFPEKIVAAGLTDMKAPTPYAKGALVLWARKDSPLQPISLEKIEGSEMQSLAIADELHAPYGRAAIAALQKLKVYEKVKARLVTAENVGQAGQFAESGNAQAGLISLTLASSAHFKEVGTYVLVPTVTYPEIRQCAVVLKTDRKVEGQKFLDWMLSAEVQGHLKDFGLAPVR